MRRGRGKLAPGFGGSSREGGKPLDAALRDAKQSGAINLSNKELTEFPQELVHFSDVKVEGNWWEYLELQRCDLSYNRIQVIPQEFAQQEHLTILRMSNNSLVQLPDGLFRLTGLKLIDFSFNYISALPETFPNCVSLVEVLLRHNQLRELPYDLGNLVALEILDVSENQISALPRTCTNFLDLKKLDISSNEFRVIESTFGSFYRLQELYAKKNMIERIEPKAITSLVNLRLLDLSENKLPTFDQFPDSNNLDIALLGFNKITAIGGLELPTGLTVLDVKNNKLQELPNSIGRLAILKTLDVSNNDISNLPNEIAGLRSLVRINIEGNPLRSIRQSVRTAGAEAIKKYLAYRTDQPDDSKAEPASFVSATWDEVLREAASSNQLKLVSRGVDNIYPGVWQLSNLQLMDISLNLIPVISAEIRMLRNLQIFRANRNKLETLPGLALAGLDALTELELGGNLLPAFLDDVTFDSIHMDRLTRLDLSSNRLTQLPNCLVCFPSLRVLIIHTNRIPDLELLCSPAFKRLEGLDVSSNQISELPEVLCSTLVNLVDLNVENNNIANLPTVLGYSARLKSIRVDGNPLKTIRRQITEKGSAAILEYLRNKCAGPPRELMERQPENAVQDPPPSIVTIPGAKGRTEMELEIVGLKAQIQHIAKRLDEDFALTVSQRREMQRELAGMRSKFSSLDRELTRF